MGIIGDRYRGLTTCPPCVTVLDKFGLTVMPGIILCMADEVFPVNRNAWLCPVECI